MTGLVVHKMLLEKKRTFATAESCTGGALAASLVAHPDASGYFQGGIIAYSNRAKVELLSVLPETVERYGAVSNEVAEEMALGAASKLHADIAVSVTGFLGPTGGRVGYVIASIAYNGKILCTWTMQNSGSRSEILAKSVEEILAKVATVVKELTG